MVILEKKIAGISRQSLQSFTAAAQAAVRLPGEANVLVASDTRLRRLNREFRGKDKATDVLSFPPAVQSGEAGDIAISADIARRNAVALGHSLLAELKVLVLHGMLHLAGYDHEKDNGRMARKEKLLRRRLGLPGSLTERASGPTAAPRSKQKLRGARISGTRSLARRNKPGVRKRRTR